MNFRELIELGRRDVSCCKVNNNIKVGDCICIVESINKNIYKGYSYKFTHFGYCAEQAALLNMFAHDEFSVSKIVTITKNGDVIPPCGRCLELISQLNNPDFIEIAITEKESKNFNEIYPYDWKKQRT